MTKYLPLFITSLLSWVTVLLLLVPLSQIVNRKTFTIYHYFLDVLVFGSYYYLYYKYFSQLSLTKSTIFSILFLLLYEFVAWGVIYKGDLWFLTLTEWGIPFILIVLVIFLIGLLTFGK